MELLVDTAVELIRAELVRGPKPRAEVVGQLADAGFKPGTIERAARCGLFHAWRDGRGKVWELYMPPAVRDAACWLAAHVTEDGVRQPVLKDRATEDGINWRTIKRARAFCPAIKAERRNGVWYWRKSASF